MKKFLIPLILLLVAATGMDFKQPDPVYGPVGCPTYSSHAVVVLYHKRNLVINGDSITCGHRVGIKLIGCTNIRIFNCKVVSGDRDTSIAVKIDSSEDIQVYNSYFANVAQGVLATNSRRIQVYGNDFLNMKSTTTGDFIQFKNVNGSGSRITKNKCENIKGSSTPQDGIDLYNCTGLSFSPIAVTYNYIRGGGPSKTGSGIHLGDTGGAHQLAENNFLVNCGTYGFLLGNAKNLLVLHNRVFSKQVIHVSYAGIKLTAFTTTKPTITNNIVNWKDSANTRRDTIFTSLHPTGYLVNTLAASIDSTIMPVQLLNRCNHLGF